MIECRTLSSKLFSVYNGLYLLAFVFVLHQLYVSLVLALLNPSIEGFGFGWQSISIDAQRLSRDSKIQLTGLLKYFDPKYVEIACALQPYATSRSLDPKLLIL